MQIDADYSGLEKELDLNLDKMLAERKAQGWRPDQAKECFQTACSFLEGSKRCLIPKVNADGSILTPQVPAIVMLSFACELFLKSQMLQDGTSQRGHKLDDLFNQNKKDFQALVATYYKLKTKRDDTKLRADLISLSSSFQEWRYLYEAGKRYKIRFQLLISFAQSLLEACIATNKNWVSEQSDWIDDLRAPFSFTVIASTHESGLSARISMTARHT